jgi:hypothetical protein
MAASPSSWDVGRVAACRGGRGGTLRGPVSAPARAGRVAGRPARPPPDPLSPGGVAFMIRRWPPSCCASRHRARRSHRR